MYHQPISQWAVEDRPREKLMQRGMDALTDAELVAILLGHGFRNKSALALARELLDRFDGLGGLARTGVDALTAVPGIGPAKAVGLVAAFEMGRRKGIGLEPATVVRQAQDVARYFSAKLADLDQEVFYVVYLNRANEIRAVREISRGGLTSTVIDPRIVFREAVSLMAASIILVHNHPSGSLRPSEADLSITRRLSEAAKLFDMQVLDHIIVSARGHYSFADHQVL
ncbi:MAG: DNA repair protein RadC [Bacteroidia bacterium]|nr:DNA repair protein RadC [Bacteroidia bacterium]